MKVPLRHGLVPVKKKTVAERRIELRDDLWPNAADEVWSRKTEKGFSTIPRTLSLIMTLIDQIGPKGKNASLVYCDFWCRVFDEAMLIEVTDEQELAYSSGFITPRSLRSWQERVNSLEKHGFIRVQAKGLRKHGFILIRHPHIVVQELRKKGLVPDSWWNAFRSMIATYKSKLPPL
jgi:hypothetical protein